MMIHLSCTFRRRWPSRLSVHKTSRMSFSLLKGHILSNSMTCFLFLFFSTKSYWVVWVLKPDQTHTANSKEKWNLKQKAPLCFGSGIDLLHIEVSLCDTWMAHIVRCFEVLVRLEISIYHLVWLIQNANERDQIMFSYCVIHKCSFTYFQIIKTFFAVYFTWLRGGVLKWIFILLDHITLFNSSNWNSQ